LNVFFIKGLGSKSGGDPQHSCSLLKAEMKYGTVQYIFNRVSKCMDEEITMANDSQNQEDREKNKFEFHLFKNVGVTGWELWFVITKNERRIYVTSMRLNDDCNKENEKTEFLYDQYQMYKTNAALHVFSNNPIDKPEKLYYTFFE
jgi:hypothetical protein